MTQHQPVPQPAPKKAARPAQPGWTYLAHKLLQRLQDHEDLPESDADATDDPARLRAIVEAGCDKARALAQDTMRDVRSAMGLNYR